MNPQGIRRITIGLVVGVAIALGLWDVFAEATAGDQATISRILLNGAHQYPIIPFAFGLLMGHFFGGQTDA